MSEPSDTRSEGWGAALLVYFDRRIVTVFALGFASGLPLLLTFSTLSVWLTEVGVTRTTIGLFAMVGIPYSLKFIWAPLMDHLPLGPLTRIFGRRRGWMLVTQAGIIVAIVLMAGSDPRIDPWQTAVFALLITSFSASQDIVIDAFRVEILDKAQYGAGAATVVTGYRIGMLVGGAGALYLADAYDWRVAYLAMAAAMIVGVLAALGCKEPAFDRDTEAPPPVPGLARFGASFGQAGHWLEVAVVRPFADFMTRPGWLWVLLFVVFYKLGDSLAGVMANVFYIDIGFTKSEIASVSKVFGLVMTLIGAFLGGVMVARYSIMWSLLVCGVLQMLSNLTYAVQALVGDHLPMLAVTIATENITGGMGTAAFVAYLSALCNLRYTATQYALVSSFMALARTTLSAGGGAMADATDWVSFFVLTTFAAVPGLMLLYWLMKSGQTGEVADERADRGP